MANKLQKNCKPFKVMDKKHQEATGFYQEITYKKQEKRLRQPPFQEPQAAEEDPVEDLMVGGLRWFDVL